MQGTTQTQILLMNILCSEILQDLCNLDLFLFWNFGTHFDQIYLFSVLVECGKVS